MSPTPIPSDPDAMPSLSIEYRQLRENLPLGIFGGIMGGILGVILWAAITYFTGVTGSAAGCEHID